MTPIERLEKLRERLTYSGPDSEAQRLLGCAVLELGSIIAELRAAPDAGKLDAKILDDSATLLTASKNHIDAHGLVGVGERAEECVKYLAALAAKVGEKTNG